MSLPLEQFSKASSVSVNRIREQFSTGRRYLGQALGREELRVRVLMVRLAPGDGGRGGGDVRAVVRVTGTRRGCGFRLPVRRAPDTCHLVAHPALRTAGEDRETTWKATPAAPSAQHAR